MIFKSAVVGVYQVNCYIIADDKSKEAVVIDPGDEYSKISNILSKNMLLPKLIINTHGHIDHIGCDDKFNLPVYIHRLDKNSLNDPEKNLSSFLSEGSSFNVNVITLEDKQTISLGDLEFNVIHTPGHTPGGICLKIDNMLFSGDTLFYQGIGRTDFPGACHSDLIYSIREKLYKLPSSTIVYPGHGPKTSIKEEKMNNPFVCESI